MDGVGDDIISNYSGLTLRSAQIHAEPEQMDQNIGHTTFLITRWTQINWINQKETTLSIAH